MTFRHSHDTVTMMVKALDEVRLVENVSGKRPTYLNSVHLALNHAKVEREAYAKAQKAMYPLAPRFYELLQAVDDYLSPLQLTQRPSFAAEIGAVLAQADKLVAAANEGGAS